MHKCGKRGCQKQVEDSYRFCFLHKDTPYKDTCKIHGKQVFIAGECQKCKTLKQGIYRIYKRNGKYYFNRSKKPIDKNSKYYFLKPYFDVLTHKTRQFQEKQVSTISESPGVYGIFVRDRNKKNQLGKCLYIGQSVNLKRRIAQHKKNIVTASNQIKGIRLKAKKNYRDWKKMVPKEKRKVENKYYIMSQYYMKDLKFTPIVKVDKKYWNKLTEEQKKLLLCFLEQVELDTFKPESNTFASRPSYK